MDLFKTKMTAPDDSKVTIVEKKHVVWNTGLKGQGTMLGKKHSKETRDRFSKMRKGVPLSEQHRINVIAASARRKGVPLTGERLTKIKIAPCKKTMTPNGVFPSLKAVAEAAGVSTVTIRKWMKKWPEHYYYITKEAK